MQLIEAFRLAFQALWANKMRSILTLIGVVMGVASVIMVITLVQGANRYVATKLTNYGADVFSVRRGGLIFDVAADCFRHEPSRNLDRMQSFRMREYVFIGAPADVTAFRARWLERAQGIADQLGLTYRLAGASDPFFGRVGKIMAVSQIEQALKLEMLIPVRSAEDPTACMSFNCHRDHFGAAWGLRSSDGAVAHTG